MGSIGASILNARVMHKRLAPKINKFEYGIYYLALPLESIEDKSLDQELPINRFGLQSFYEKDHGQRDGSSLKKWALDILSAYNVNDVDQITLICMPRVLGYVFNPVSFWVCYDASEQIRAVICEVNNTFGETHSYVCLNRSAADWAPNTTYKAKKSFHVSPFIERSGSYEFRFDLSDQRCEIRIDHQDEDECKQLITVLNGRFESLNKKELQRTFFSHPLITFKAITLIHYQAFKLMFKKIKYRRKPPQFKTRVTLAEE